MRFLAVLCLVLIGACASFAEIENPPVLENRTLRISSGLPGLEYQWRECVDKGLFRCRKWEMKKDFYDLTDPLIREKLINMGFVARVRDKVLP